MLWLSLSLLVVSATFCAADIPTIGPCDVNIQTQRDFDFDKFHTENGGSWDAVYGPATTFNKDLKSLHIKITPTGKAHQYRDLISYVTKAGKTGILADEIIDNSGNGVVTATTTDNHVFKINVLKYSPGRYTFYYICSAEGTDQAVDYRYVLAHGPLSPAEKAEVDTIDKKYKFEGQLIPIGGSK